MYIKKNLSIKNLLFNIIFYCSVISAIYSEGLFSYLDEIAGIVSAIVISAYFIFSKLSRNLFGIFIVIVLLVIEGIVSNLFSGVERSTFVILVDILTTIKPFVTLIAVLQLAAENQFSRLKKNLKGLLWSALFFIVVLFIANFFGIVSMSDDDFLGIMNFKFVFDYSAYFGIFLFSFYPFLLSNNKRTNSILAIIIFTLMTFTFKSQVLFFVVVFIGLMILENMFNIQTKIKHLVVIVLSGIIFVFPAIQNYFITSRYSPRKVLLEGAIDLMSQYFPLGSGFATYGSPIASQSYSPIYVERNFYFLYGLGQENDMQFLNDNFLSSIIGQFGFLGIIIFIALIFLIIIRVIKCNLPANLRVYCLTVIISLLVTTISSSFMTSSLGVLHMVIVGMILNQKYRDS